jgi:hypothetical protein
MCTRVGGTLVGGAIQLPMRVIGSWLDAVSSRGTSLFTKACQQAAGFLFNNASQRGLSSSVS